MPQGSQRPQEFLQDVRDRVQAALPEPLKAFRSRVVFSTLQLHYGDPRVHYEVWVQRRAGRIEVGLHFEGEREANYRWAGLLAPRVYEVQHAVGTDVELEEWTASWTRLHVTVPFQTLGGGLARDVADRLSALVAYAQPLLWEHGAGSGAAAGTGRARDRGRRWRRGARR
jgi:hypothetical protein